MPGMGVFFGTGVQADLKDSNVNAMYWGQGGLGLGDRDYYTDDTESAKKVREAYRTYLGTIAHLIGYDDAAAQRLTDNVLALETELAQNQMTRTEQRNIAAQYNPSSVAELVKTYPSVDLKHYFELQGLDVDTVIVDSPKYYATVAKALTEKDEQMQLFISGKAQIMVATTVIEVGVNVPNASVMIIENAERFGLSQLHQLRGRGRGVGADQSYCILVTNYKLTEDTRKRLEIMVRTNDGFEIAEADLKLRGPGDLEGTQQSGVAFDLKIADIARDGQLLQYVRAIAEEIVEQDPAAQNPENEILWRQLKSLRKTNVNWAAIS